MKKIFGFTLANSRQFSPAVLFLFLIVILLAFESASAQVKQEWVARYNGPDTQSTDSATALAVDAAGNVYVTGSSSGPVLGSGYATIKYDAAGNQLWVARYNGPDNGEDRAAALAVDAAGNVYVTGSSPGSGTGFDYATIKYDAAGNELWVARYNGPDNGDDRAAALAVDAAGNVYVTGSSRGLSTPYDFATIKYDAAGNPLWVARYDGPSEYSADYAIALTVDVAGSVCVTGWSSGPGTGADYATVKYDAAGNQLWVARYNGPDTQSADTAAALAVDAAGNVYVTGSSTSTGLSTSSGYATIKYDAAGNQLWVARYNGPDNGEDRAAALAVDAAGNVYVTGTISVGFSNFLTYDYATIKYDAAGNELWAARYESRSNGFSVNANALAVDAAGNVYVTGTISAGFSNLLTYKYATIKYDAAGNELWVARYNGPGDSYDRALAVDAAGNVHVTGISSGDYATVKYDAAGNELWVARYNSPGKPPEDYARALAVDAAGNVYVMGSSTGQIAGNDYATVKYDAAGNELWAARYESSSYGPFVNANALAVDAAGNVYVAGHCRGIGHQSPLMPQNRYNDYATVKYDAAGNQLWMERYRTDNVDDSATALAVDTAGNVYVTGGSSGSFASLDYATIKYDAAGNQLWAARYDGPANSVDHANGLAVDAAGNVYVTGSSTGSGTGFDYATVKYDAAGNQLWAARLTGPGNYDDVAAALGLDAAGNVYVTGSSYDPSTGVTSDYATVKYDASGNELWVARYNGPDNGEDRAAALAVDAAGNVYVTGSSRGLSTPSDFATVKYDAAGNQLWVARYNGPDNGEDHAAALAVDAAGNVYVTGESSGDYATVKYDAAGNELWVARYNGPGNDWDSAAALAVDAAGNVYVTGSSTGSGTGYDFATIKLVSIGNPSGGGGSGGGGNGGSDGGGSVGSGGNNSGCFISTMRK